MKRAPALTVSEERGVRTLHVGGEAIQSSMRLSDPYALELDYTRCMMAFLLFHTRPRRALKIGLGGGSLVKFFWRRLPWLRTRVVELDARVVAVAREQFHLPPDDARLSIEVGDGAVVGLMAGAFGAVVWLVLSPLIHTFMAPMQSGMVQQVLRDSTNLPPAMRDILESAQSGPAIGLGLVFSFFVMLTVTTMFGMLGGIFGALLFRKTPPPVIPPPIPQ